MIRIQLPQAEADRLTNLFQATDDRKLRDRLQIILMAQRGRARQDIAQDLGMHRRSVTRWLNAHSDGGLDALRPRKAKGNPPKIPASLAEDIRTWVINVSRASRRQSKMGTRARRLTDFALTASSFSLICSEPQLFGGNRRRAKPPS